MAPTQAAADNGNRYARHHACLGNTVNLYFVRHASAQSKASWDEDDDLRPLTRRGRERFSAGADALVRAGVLECDLIVSSPLVRAMQTAELLRDALGGAAAIEEDARLGHGFDLPALASIIAERSASDAIAIVGHNPSFAAVLSAATGGSEIEVRKGAIALVEIGDTPGPIGRLLWLAPLSLFAEDR